MTRGPDYLFMELYHMVEPDTEEQLLQMVDIITDTVELYYGGHGHWDDDAGAEVLTPIIELVTGVADARRYVRRSDEDLVSKQVKVYSLVEDADKLFMEHNPNGENDG